MAKIIFLVAGLLLAYLIFKSWRRKADRDEPPRQTSGEDMVRCAECGVHLPRSESITTGGQFFCSTEHQRLHRKPG
ncbi:MAG: PP0621 family protein [Burkholderiales bacterium]